MSPGLSDEIVKLVVVDVDLDSIVPGCWILLRSAFEGCCCLVGWVKRPMKTEAKGWIWGTFGDMWCLFLRWLSHQKKPHHIRRIATYKQKLQFLQTCSNKHSTWWFQKVTNAVRCYSHFCGEFLVTCWKGGSSNMAVSWPLSIYKLRWPSNWFPLRDGGKGAKLKGSMKGNASYLCATHLAEVRFLEHILLLGNKAKNPSLRTSLKTTPNNVVEESGRWRKLFWVVEEDGEIDQ